jgi:hypothetical protein
MKDIMGHSAHMQRFGNADSFGQQCMKTQENSSEDATMSEARQYQYKRCHATHQQPSD